MADLNSSGVYQDSFGDWLEDRERIKNEINAPIVVPNQAYGAMAMPMMAQKRVGAPRNRSASLICQ